MEKMRNSNHWLNVLFLVLSITAAFALAVGFMRTVRASGGETFIVDSPQDSGDAGFNCQCDDGAGHCTLRAAIQEANACPGDQTIRFASNMWLQPGTALPPLAGDGTTIDGSDRWYEYEGDKYTAITVDGQDQDFYGFEIVS